MSTLKRSSAAGSGFGACPRQDSDAPNSIANDASTRCMNHPLREVFSNLCFDTRSRIFDSIIVHPQEHQSTYIAAGKEIQNEWERSAIYFDLTPRSPSRRALRVSG